MNKKRKAKKYDAIGNDWAAVQMSMTLEQEELLTVAGHQTITMPIVGDGTKVDYTLDGQPLKGDCCVLNRRLNQRV